MTPKPAGSPWSADFEELGKLATTLVYHQDLSAASYIIGILQTDLAEQGYRPIIKQWPIPGQAAPQGWTVYASVLRWCADGDGDGWSSKR